MNKQVKIADIYDVMVEMLANGGKVTFDPKGISMLPTIHNSGDKVELSPVNGSLKKYDLPFYKRENGQFVLHRIVGINDDGTYNMCGDNQWQIEKGINNEQIIGVVSVIYRGKTVIDCNNSNLYKLYVRLWVAIMPLRHLFIGGSRKLYRIITKKQV